MYSNLSLDSTAQFDVKFEIKYTKYTGLSLFSFFSSSDVHLGTIPPTHTFQDDVFATTCNNRNT